MTIHFGTLMDLCHLKNSELEQIGSRTYEGRVVLRGDVAYAVFAETGFVGIPNDGGKSHGELFVNTPSKNNYGLRNLNCQRVGKA